MIRETALLPANSHELASAIPVEEYKRLLGLPRSFKMSAPMFDQAQKARQWYATYGNPFVATSKLKIKSIESSVIHLENNIKLSSAELAKRLRTNDAHALVILAASAGTAVAREVASHWSEGRPDQAFFLDRFAVAVTEHLIRWSSAFLCRAAEPFQETLLPHLSPGCGDWVLSDQLQLMATLTHEQQIGPLRMLSTGALDPAYSVMAASGVTRQHFHPATLKDICRSCDLDPCAFRRAPHQSLHED